MPNLALGFVVEGHNPRDGWHGLTGRIDAARLSLLAPDFRERTVFCCGPEPFMRGVRDMLKVCGFDMDRYHEESFSFEAPATAEPVPEVADAASGAADAAEPAPRFTVTLKRGERFECGPDETLLEAARRAGLRWPFSCSSGVCGTCRTRRLSGEVQMSQGGGLRPREVAQGWMLPCCSRPLGDLELDR